MNQGVNDLLFKEVFDQIKGYYESTKKIYKSTGYEKSYPLGAHWVANMRGLIELIQKEDAPHKKISVIHETVMYSINTADKVLQGLMVEWYQNYFQMHGMPLTSLNSNIQESKYSSNANSIFVDGRCVSPDFLRTVLICQEIKQHCKFPENKFTVLELGAGYGGLARTLRLFYPNITTVITDIPETLYFSFIFLRLNFPEHKFCFVTDRSQLENVDLKIYDFVFVPTMFAEYLKDQSFELFYNTASLGEMRNEVIRYWMDFVQNKIKVNYFFGLNRYLNAINPSKESMRKKENECSVLFDPWWEILQWELDPPLARCPYLETLCSRNLEIIAKRIPLEQRQQVNQNKIQAEQIIKGIEKEDWFTQPTVRNYRISLNGVSWPLTNTRADRLLTPDLSMKGVLFALWNSIRLNPTQYNIHMMLQYFNVLEGKNPFEERFYYQALYKKITGRKWGKNIYLERLKRLVKKH